MKKTIIISILLVVLVAGIIQSQESVRNTDDIFTNLKSNTPGRAEAVFSMDNPLPLHLSKTALALSFNEVCGEVKGYQILLRDTCHKVRLTYNTYQECNYNFTVGKNVCKEKINYSDSLKTDVYYLCWKEVSSIPAGENDYKIKLDIAPANCGDGFGYKVDWISSLTVEDETYTQTKWAWMNVSMAFKRNVTCTGIGDNYPLMINGSYGVKINGTPQYIWTVCKGSATALYFNNATHYFVANDTAMIPFEVENGTLVTGMSNRTGVWKHDNDLSYRGVYHLNHTSMANDSTSRLNNGSVYGNIAGTGTISTPLAGGYDFDGNADYVGLNLTYWSNVTGHRTYMYLVNYDNLGSPEYAHYDFGTYSKTQLYSNATDVKFASDNAVSGWEYLGTPVTTGNWNLITVVVDLGDYMAIIRNKTLIQNNTAIGGSYDTNPALARLGYADADCFDGKFGEVRLIEGLLSWADINRTWDNIVNTAGYGNVMAIENQAGGGAGSWGGTDITLHTPIDATWTSNLTQGFNFTAVHNYNNTVNCSLKLVLSESYGRNISVLNNTATVLTPNSSLASGDATWLINCSDYSGTPVFNASATYDIYLDRTSPRIENFNITPLTLYTLNTSNAFLNASDTGQLTANLSCFVNGSSVLNDTNNALTNGTTFNFDTIGAGNYSKGDNLSCDVTVWDNVSLGVPNTNTSTAWVIISNAIPSAPTDISFSTGAFYYNYLTNFSASGSTDADNDTITYHYRVYNINDSVEVQAWDSQDNYTPALTDIGDTITVVAIATTSDANSSTTYNESEPCFLTFTNILLMREKTNTPLNISGADELSISIICEDDVSEFNLSSGGNISLNISCAYEFIKADATYGNTSYFRIINPTYSAFSNITIYMLDLRYDTGVEIILIINDLTGDFSDGEVIIERYINGSEVAIIGYPVDIENSATLYLLKDMLYTVTVKNNAGETRVIGNLIASSPGEKTLTLPEIVFLPEDAVFGDEVSWSYDYDNTSFVQLVYLDTGNTTINVSFVVMNTSNTSIAQFSGFTTNSSSVIFTYVFGNPNLTYLSNLTIHHPTLGMIFEQKVFYPGLGVVEPAEQSLFPNIGVYLYWMALIFVFLIGLSFSARSSKIGLVAVMFFLMMFIYWGFISFGAVTWIVVGLFGALTVMNLISKSKEVKE